MNELTRLKLTGTFPLDSVAVDASPLYLKAAEVRAVSRRLLPIKGDRRESSRLRILSLALTALWIAGCASGPKPGASTGAKMEPAALALLNTVSAKLGGAQTLQVEAEHRLDPKLGLDLRIDHGDIELAVKRPNQFYAIQSAGAETREVVFDGHILYVMHPGLKHHASEPLEAKTIEQFAQLAAERFGFRPPMADLLANNMAAELLFEVTSAQLLREEHVGWTRCEHLRLDQAGMTTDLWVGAEDRLPRRMLTTVTDMPGHPTWDIRFSKWKLNEPLDESLFAKRPAPDSQKVQMLKSQ